MDLTIVQQGSFTSTGANVTIPLRSGVNWMKVFNLTQAAANQTTALAVEFYWQDCFAPGQQYAYYKSNAASAANLIEFTNTGGFTFVDSTALANTPGAIVALTAISSASIPVVAATNTLSAGAVVRLINVTGATQYSGIEFTVGYNTLSSSHFSLDYAPQIVAATSGSFRTIAYGPYYTPQNYTIASISQAAQAVVVTTVAHNLTVGQAIRFNVPSAMGMVEMNGLTGNIVAVNTSTTVNSFTVDINSSGFTAFAWPLSGGVAFTPAQAIPYGEDTALANSLAVNVLGDATLNTGFIGMTLTGGAGFPGGASSDVLCWVAGKSFSSNNIDSSIVA